MPSHFHPLHFNVRLGEDIPAVAALRFLLVLKVTAWAFHLIVRPPGPIFYRPSNHRAALLARGCDLWVEVLSISAKHECRGSGRQGAIPTMLPRCHRDRTCLFSRIRCD